MKLLIVNNLASGLGDGAIFDFIRAYAEDGDEEVNRSSDRATDLRTYLSDADRFDCGVASAGDGTLSMVAYLLADTGIPILPFPAGTANLLCSNLASPAEPHAIAKMLREGRVMDFDLGEVILTHGERFGFLMMAGAGYDATIMKDAESGKKLFGQMAYLTSAVTNALPQVSTFHLSLDGEEVICQGVGVLLINFAKIQFDITVVHENKPRDGMLDVVILRTKDAFGLIPALFAAILDKGGDFPTRTDAFDIYRASEVSVQADPVLQMQFDGEVTAKMTPFQARVLPLAARFVVSEECVKTYS